MPVLSEGIPPNCVISVIERPTRGGVGGDFNLTTILESDILAIREPFNAFSLAGTIQNRDPDTANTVADNTFWIDLRSPNSEVLRQVLPGDLITWASLLSGVGGPTSSPGKAEITRSNVWDATGFIRQHIEIFAKDQGAPT